VKLKRTTILTKDQKDIKRMRTKLDKITYHKLRLKDVIENNSRFYKKNKNKN
jgi:hypothetical protein